MLQFAANFPGVLVKKNVAKGKLKLFPIGTLYVQKDPKPSMVLVEGHGLHLQVLPPKFDFQGMEGAAVPFFFVKSTTEPEKANMEFGVQKVGEWHIPVCKNKEKVEAGAQLLFLKDKAEEQEPASKKARTA